VGEFTLILDAAPDDSAATIGFNSPDCDADFAARLARLRSRPPKTAPTARAAHISKGRVHSQSKSSSSFHRAPLA